MKSETENTIEIGSQLMQGDWMLYNNGFGARLEVFSCKLEDENGITHVIRNGTILKVVPKKEPLVWTGEQTVQADDLGRAMVVLPVHLIGKMVAVEVREITDPESVPELDLSPLTKEEFWQLQPLDTVTVPELDGLVTIRQKDETYWGFRGEHNALPAFVKCNDRCSPTPETAKRLRGKVTK